MNYDDGSVATMSLEESNRASKEYKEMRKTMTHAEIVDKKMKELIKLNL